MKTGLCVGDIMTKRPICVPENLTVQDCAKILREKGVGSMLISNDDELQGILTQTDIIEKIVAPGLDPSSVRVKDIMTQAMFTIKPSMDVYEAMMIMKDNDVRHLPVLHEDRLVGFVTMKDVLKVEPALFDLILDTIELREEDRKLNVQPNFERPEEYWDDYLQYDQEEE